MKLETAIYGEVNNGHALRATSGDPGFAKRISGRFDLPSNPPPGVDWSPAISGFPIEGRYVLARTFLDTNAPRGNMVIAHALFAPLDEIQDFNALGRLIAHLATSADQIPVPTSFNIDDGAESTKTPELQQLAALLVGRRSKTIVRLGAVGVDDLVVALWRNLWPSMRREFAFRLSFAPEDLVEMPTPTIVYTSPSLVARWRDFPIIGQGTSSGGVAEEMLSGEIPSSPIVQFASRIGHVGTTLPSFARLVQAEALVSTEADLASLAAGMRLINLLSPESAKGTSAKAELVRSLAKAIASATPEHIMLLRNLSLEGFATLEEVWRAITLWMESLQLGRGGINSALLPLVLASQDATEAIEEWRSAVEAGGRCLAKRRPDSFASAFWEWLIQSPTALVAVLQLTPRGRGAEASLLGTVPRHIEFATANLLDALVDRGWLVLHGAVLAASTKAADAVHAQLKVDSDALFTDGVEAALARATPAERVSIAAANNDRRLDAIAGGAIAADHTLAKGLDYTRVEVQRLWAAAIATDSTAWQVPTMPKAACHAIMDAILSGSPTSGSIVTALATTPLADLSDYGRRGQLWTNLATPEAFLDATAEGWLQRAASGNAYTLDSRLELAILQPCHLDSWLVHDWAVSLNIIASLNGLTEHRVLRWFNERATRMPVPTHQQAELLGHIILERKWSNLLHRVRERALSHHELKAALRVCAEMFSSVSRWLMGLSEISVDEKWSSFADIAADLYPTGPEERDVWERAGGRNSDLRRPSTGAENWRYALRMVRHGNEPTASKLLLEMQRDFISNPDLRFIAADRDIAARFSNGRS